ncbi:hypothetical protein A1351_12290 [Methylosinus sp. R-45379]|nr:hypothetical protein A1351_12290 [Methylosinus sp. R-45379]
MVEHVVPVAVLDGRMQSLEGDAGGCRDQLVAGRVAVAGGIGVGRAAEARARNGRDWTTGSSIAARYALRKAASKRRRLLPPPPPPLLIQGKALAAHSTSVALRIGAAISLAIGADVLVDVFSYDSRSLPTIITALAGIAILLSGVYRILAAAHRTMAHYLRTLPVRPAYWPVRDMALVAGVGALPLLLLSIPAATHRLAASATLLGLAGADLALLAAMRFQVTHGGRHAVLLTVALAGLWSTAAMAAIAR